MHQQKIKSFLAHFVLDHISIEYLRFSYYLTIEQFKLLQFIYQFTHHHSEGLSLNAIIFYKNYQKNHLLKLITHLYDFNWISKERDPLDQRRLVINLTQHQREKVLQMFEDFKAFLEMKSKSIKHIHHFTIIPYYFTCHEQFEEIQKSANFKHLSLEELYILGLLIINNKQTTFKNIKAHSLKGLVTVSPIIKKLQLKGYVDKSRSKEDERNIVLTIKEEKVPYIKSTIEECYRCLEKGIEQL